MRGPSQLILLLCLVLPGLSGCLTNAASHRQPVPKVLLTSAQRHDLEQKRISFEHELLSLESTIEIQRLMGVYSTLEEAPVSLAVQQSYSVKRYQKLKAMIARIDYLLQ